jgi:transposase InsO family protein
MCLRNDNGSEFTTSRVREILEHLGVPMAFIEPGSLWENGYIESFKATLRRATGTRDC